jgi:mRNA interferase YafQ
MNGQIIDVKYRDHTLIGQYTGTRECHIEPDWLLIYESTVDEIVLIRIGSHSDLFKL